MKAVLIGTVEDARLYLIVDAGRGEKNGALVRQDDSVVMVDAISFSTKARNISQIRTTRFHRFFWDAPKNVTSGKWYEIFIARSKQIDKKMLDGVRVVTTLGKPAKKISSVNSRAKKFTNSSKGKKMVKSKGIEMNGSQQKMAWAAIQMLHEAGELK